MNNRWKSAAAIVAALLICVAALLAWYFLHQAKTAPRPSVSAMPLPPPSRSAVPAAPRSPRPFLTPGVVHSPKASAAPLRAPSPAVRPETLNPGSTPSPMRITHPVATIVPGVMPPVIREPPDSPPQILAFRLSSPVVQAGDVVSGMVETSSNVASVEARIGGYGATMQKVGVGRFTLTYRVPNLPFFLHRTFMVQIIARNTRGQAVSTAIPVTIR